MKKRYLLVLLPLAYIYGFLTVHMKIFPYEQFRQLKHLISMDSVLANRIEDTSGHVPLTSIDGFTDRLVFLTYGQSNAANTGQLGYDVKHPVFMVYDGESYKYADPSLGTTGPNASVWGRVGDKLIEENVAPSVFFINAAWGGASMDELVNDHPYVYLEDHLKRALETFGQIDGVLMHHGERHNRNIKGKRVLGSEVYRPSFEEFLGRLRKITDAPVYVSQVSYCGDRGIDDDLLLVQNNLIKDIEGVLRGPDSDSIVDVKYRLPDQCHFSSEGLDVLADSWVEAIQAQSED